MASWKYSSGISSRGDSEFCKRAPLTGLVTLLVISIGGSGGGFEELTLSFLIGGTFGVFSDFFWFEESFFVDGTFGVFSDFFGLKY